MLGLQRLMCYAARVKVSAISGGAKDKNKSLAHLLPTIPCIFAAIYHLNYIVMAILQAVENELRTLTLRRESKFGSLPRSYQQRG